MPELDAPYLTKLKEEFEAEFRPLRQIETEMRDLYFQLYDIKAPKDFEPERITVGIGSMVVDGVMGLFPGPPRLSMHIPGGGGKQSQSLAARIADWMNTFFWATDLELQDELFEKQKMSAFMYGVGWLKGLPARNFWASYPSRRPGQTAKSYISDTDEWKRTQRLPIAFRHVPSPYMHWRNKAGQLHEIMEIKEVPAYEVLARFDVPKLREKMGRDSGGRYRAVAEREMVTFVEYANSQDFVYAVSVPGQGDLEIAKTWQHGLGMVPYVPMRGFITAETDIDKQNLGLLYHMRHGIKQLSRLLSQKATAVRIWAWATPRLQLSPEWLTQRGEEFKLELRPGEVITLYPGEVLDFLTYTGTGQDINDLISFFNSSLERLGIVPVMMGLAPADTSGYAMAIRTSAAQGKFRPLADRIAMARVQEGNLLLLCHKSIGETVEVLSQEGKWFELDPKDIPPDYILRAGPAGPEVPTDLVALIYAGIAAGSQRGPALGPLLPDRYIWEHLLRVNPEEMEKQLYLQQARHEAEPLILRTYMEDVDLVLSEEEQIGLDEWQGIPLPMLLALMNSGMQIPPGLFPPSPVSGVPGAPNQEVESQQQGRPPGLPRLPRRRRPGSKGGRRPPGGPPGPDIGVL